jgi:hypothetical protein
MTKWPAALALAIAAFCCERAAQPPAAPLHPRTDSTNLRALASFTDPANTGALASLPAVEVLDASIIPEVGPVLDAAGIIEEGGVTMPDPRP